MHFLPSSYYLINPNVGATTHSLRYPILDDFMGHVTFTSVTAPGISIHSYLKLLIIWLWYVIMCRYLHYKKKGKKIKLASKCIKKRLSTYALFQEMIFLSCSKERTSQETKYEEMRMPIYFILCIKNKIDRWSTVKIN